MGPGSFGTGKPNQLWERIRPRERSASMGPGSFGTGKSLRPESHRSTRSVPASMGPGSFGTGKCGWSSTTRGRRTIGFNGARFFWNREDSERAPGAPTSKHRFNGARFFWNREVEAAINAREVETLRASMGPGSFGTGKPPLDALPMAKGADNLASMGPGSFGTGKKVRQGGAKPPTFLMLQWGPVLLEPGSHWRGRASDECNDLRCFNGARFFWNREAGFLFPIRPVLGAIASMGPGSFGTGKPVAGAEVVKDQLPAASMGPGSFGTGKGKDLGRVRSKVKAPASMGPGSFGTGKEVDDGDGAVAVEASMGPGSFGTGKGLTESVRLPY